MRAALRGDCHTHSDWSDGGSPPREMADGSPRPRPRVDRADRPLAAADRRQRTVRGAPARAARAGQPAQRRAGPVPHPDRDRGRHPRRRLARPDARPARPARRRGGQRALQAADARRADDRPHGQPRCPARTWTCWATAPGGCWAAGAGRSRSSTRSSVFTACRDHGVAVEINCRPERQDPPDRLLSLAAEIGCLFAIDTDAHAPGQLDWLDSGCARAERHGIAAGPGDQHPQRRRRSPPKVKLLRFLCSSMNLLGPGPVNSSGCAVCDGHAASQGQTPSIGERGG